MIDWTWRILILETGERICECFSHFGDADDFQNLQWFKVIETFKWEMILFDFLDNIDRHLVVIELS